MSSRVVNLEEKAVTREETDINAIIITSRPTVILLTLVVELFRKNKEIK